MYRQIAQLDEKRQLAPGVVVHGESECWLVNQGLEVVLVGHLHGIVGRIDPLHRQFQRLPAANGTHGRRRGKDLLRLYCGGGKEGVFFLGG